MVDLDEKWGQRVVHGNLATLVLQLAPDSMLTFSLPYLSGLSFDNFYYFQIFFIFIYEAFYLMKLHGKQIQKFNFI